MTDACGRRRALRAASGVAVLALLGGCQSDVPNVEGRTPDATVTMSKFQAALMGSGSGGSGTLDFRGATYGFSVAGVGVGGIGASTIEAEGEVFGLTDLAQFPGTYAQARAGFAFGPTSGGTVWLRNGNGVIMRLHAARSGLMLSLGADAIVISWSGQPPRS